MRKREIKAGSVLFPHLMDGADAKESEETVEVDYHQRRPGSFSLASIPSCIAVIVHGGEGGSP